MNRDHSLLGLRLVMKEHPGATFRVTDPGEISRWLGVDVVSRPMGRPDIRYAVWKATGNVHRVQEEGEPYPEAVTDNPVFAVPEGWRTDAAMVYDSGGLWVIQQERVRQIEEEEYDADHDDAHRSGQLANAATCYAATFPVTKVMGYSPYLRLIDAWPWTYTRPRLERPGHEQGHVDLTLTGLEHEEHDRERLRRLVAPADIPEHAARIKELAKAGALIAAEIDRLQRLAIEQGLEYDAADED